MSIKPNPNINYSISYLICLECKNSFPIPRKFSSQRGPNHIKTMYCPYCKKESDFIENINKGLIKNEQLLELVDDIDSEYL